MSTISTNCNDYECVVCKTGYELVRESDQLKCKAIPKQSIIEEKPQVGEKGDAVDSEETSIDVKKRDMDEKRRARRKEEKAITDKEQRDAEKAAAQSISYFIIGIIIVAVALITFVLYQNIKRLVPTRDQHRFRDVHA